MTHTGGQTEPLSMNYHLISVSITSDVALFIKSHCDVTSFTREMCQISELNVKIYRLISKNLLAMPMPFPAVKHGVFIQGMVSGVDNL